MYFKNVEMRGFKSFVDATTMTFERGVTAIVGPNGCGKSNIADALRWVLGEQSAKSMRGAKMEDFIFNGSSTRKPTGFAEVSLTISDIDGAISSQLYTEYEELTVTRKLYRNGDSEYMINKVPCRLKDIVDVFLDTGINARALSIIEQGQVNRIVNSRPDDRKVFIDEAAGIMKYKVRRHAAMNKLEASQQNLLRIQDILGELERQRNSLNRQAKKAERYKSFRTEIREAASVHFASEYTSHTRISIDLADQLEQLREREAGLLAELATRRNNLESLNIEIAKAENAASAYKEQRGSALSAIEKNEHHRELLARQIEELSEESIKAGREITLVEEQIAQTDTQIVERRNELEKSRERIGGKLDLSGSLRDELETTQKLLAEQQREIDIATQASLRVLEDISSRRDNHGSINAKLEMSADRLNTLSEKKQELISGTAAVQERNSGLRDRLSRLKVKQEQEIQERETIKSHMAETIEKLETADSDLRSVSDMITKDNSRLESLQELERNFEGYGEGVRKLMKLKEEGSESLAGVRGLVTGGIKSSPELETAMAGVLGPRLEAIVIDTSQDSLEAIEMMKHNELGGASFAPSDMIAGKVAPSAPDHPALVGRASELFELDNSLAPGVHELLSGSFVARDLQGAVEIWKQRPGAYTVVTLEGEVIDHAGFITGGSGISGAAGIVSRKRIIKELALSIAELDRKKGAAQSLRDSLRDTRLSCERKLADADESLRGLELEILGLDNEIRKTESDLARMTESLDSVNSETIRLSAERDSLSAELGALVSDIEGLTKLKSRLDADNEQKQEELRQTRRSLDDTSEKLKKVELEVTEIRGKHENLNMDIKRLEAIKAGHITQIQRLKDSIRESELKRSEMNDSIESILSENVELARREDTLSGKITALSGALEEKGETASTLRGVIAELQDTLEKVQPQISEVSLKRSETEMRIENIIEKADAEFNIPLEDLKETCVEGIDIEEVTKRLNFLRGEIARIGDVNLSALDEYEQVNNRWEFLKTQQEDLAKSISTLHKTIENINTTTRKLFMETFETVSRNFETTFRRLFGGGRAQMRLVHEEGKLEPGVEIMAQPPGKKNQSINLLSAGEKAMTAISLLFAVFQAKPSPFCLLDEIDAPLDEANIGRFREMIQEMQTGTQFIIITHNQKTMSFADRLYGVTQEEEGVSKALAVNLHDERGATPVAAA